MRTEAYVFRPGGASAPSKTIVTIKGTRVNERGELIVTLQIGTDQKSSFVNVALAQSDVLPHISEMFNQRLAWNKAQSEEVEKYRP